MVGVHRRIIVLSPKENCQLDLRWCKQAPRGTCRYSHLLTKFAQSTEWDQSTFTKSPRRWRIVALTSDGEELRNVASTRLPLQVPCWDDRRVHEVTSLDLADWNQFDYVRYLRPQLKLNETNRCSVCLKWAKYEQHDCTKSHVDQWYNTIYHISHLVRTFVLSRVSLNGVELKNQWKMHAK